MIQKGQGAEGQRGEPGWSRGAGAGRERGRGQRGQGQRGKGRRGRGTSEEDRGQRYRRAGGRGAERQGGWQSLLAPRIPAKAGWAFYLTAMRCCVLQVRGILMNIHVSTQGNLLI